VVHSIFTEHSWVSFYRSLQQSMPRKCNSQLLLISDFGTRFLVRYCVASIVANNISPLAILSVFKVMRMSDCCSCSHPPFLAIVADISKTYKNVVAACKNEIWLLPLPYTIP